MLKSFVARNFRCFKELRLDTLGRMNLIAGDNGVGKTALLEAIFLHLGPTNAALTTVVDRMRGLPPFEADGDKQWGWLFRNKETQVPIGLDCELADGVMRHLALRLGSPQEYRIEKGTGQGQAGLSARPTTFRTSGSELIMEYQDSTGTKTLTKGLLTVGGQKGRELVAVQADPPVTVLSPKALLFRSFVPGFEEDAERLNAMVARKTEGQLLKAVQRIQPAVQGLVPGYYAQQPMIYGDVGFRERIPLALAGDGMLRLVRYLVGIADCAGGVVLIDEVENGFYHSVLPKLWQALAVACEGANVQLFATTHSWECIGAAYEALKDTSSTFFLHRLERSEDGIIAITLDRQHIETALKCELEVR